MIQKLNPDSFGFLVLIALFSALAALGTDMALSGVTLIGAAFSVSSGTVGITLSAFMAGFAGSPLVYGPLSDRFGRKPIMLASTAIYTLAGLACAFAPTFEALVAWRFLQGCGAGASRSLPAAVIRDLFTGAAARSKQSYMAVMQLLAPLLAPSLGAVLLLLFDDWRSIFLFLSASGALTFVSISLWYAEFCEPKLQNRLTSRQLLVNYLRVFTTRQSLKFLLIQALMFGCLFSYVTGSPLIIMEAYGLSPTSYGMTFALTTGGIVTGSFVSGRCNARGVAARVLITAGLAVSLACTVALVALALLSALPLAVLLGLVVLVCFSFGLVVGNAVQLALEPMGDIAGVTSAAVSASALGFGAIMGLVVSLLHDGTPLVTAAAMAACAVLALAIYRVL